MLPRGPMANGDFGGASNSKLASKALDRTFPQRHSTSKNMNVQVTHIEIQQSVIRDAVK